MASFTSTLFIGIPKTDEVLEALAAADPSLTAMFIHQNYLVEVEHLGVIYLGKAVGTIAGLKELGDIEAFVISILKKITPNLPVKNARLIAIRT